MRKATIIFIGIITFCFIYTAFLPQIFAAVNSNNSTTASPPPIIIQQQPSNPPPIYQVAPNGVQDTARPTDMYGVISLLVTGLAIPAIAGFNKYLDKKGAEDHKQNEFRLKAMTSALSTTSNSLEETDKANTDNAKLLKMIKDDLLKEGGKISQATADAIEKNYKDCEADIQAYYYRSPPIKDEFDTCNDPIVQKVVEVRDKTIATK